MPQSFNAQTLKNVIFALVLLMISIKLSAMPMDESLSPFAEDLELPNHLQGMRFLKDHEYRILYIQPRYGRIAMAANQQPLVSFATFGQAENKMGLLNLEVDFTLSPEDFATIKEAAGKINYSVRYLPWSSTKPFLALPTDTLDVCAFSLVDEASQANAVCDHLVAESSAKANGPTLGETVHFSFVLNWQGVDLVQKILKTINGIQVGLELQFHVFTGQNSLSYSYSPVTLMEKIYEEQEHSFSGYLNQEKIDEFLENLARCASTNSNDPDCLIGDKPVVVHDSTTKKSISKGDLYEIEAILKTDWLTPVIVDQQWSWTLNPSKLKSYTSSYTYHSPNYTTTQTSEIRGSLISAAIGCLAYDEATGDFIKRDEGSCLGYWP